MGKTMVECYGCGKVFKLQKRHKILGGEGHNRKPLLPKGKMCIIKCPYCQKKLFINTERYCW